MKNKLQIPKIEENEYTDIELYNRLKGGGEEAHRALEILYKRCSPRIYAYCRKILGDIPATDDSFQ